MTTTAGSGFRLAARTQSARCQRPLSIGRLRRERAFTLIEVLVVILIIGILAAIAMPTFGEASSDARSYAVRGNLDTAAWQATWAAAIYSEAGDDIATGQGLVEQIETAPPQIGSVELLTTANELPAPGTVAVCSDSGAQDLRLVAVAAGGAEYLAEDGGTGVEVAAGTCQGFDAGTGARSS